MPERPAFVPSSLVPSALSGAGAPGRTVHPVAAVAHRVRSAHNVGAMLRTSDAAGLAHLYLTGFTPTPAHPSVHKTALGAEDWVPWSHHDDVIGLIRRLQAEGYTVVALEQTAAPRPVDRFHASDFPLAFVVGNEVEGVAAEVLAACDAAVEIPQYGQKHSLNVSVAFGIAAYDLVRRWHAVQPLVPEARERKT